MSLSGVALADALKGRYETWDDVQRMLDSSPDIDKRVAGVAKSYQVIDVKETISQLTQIGSLLNLADAGALRTVCSGGVSGIIMQSHDLISESHVSCGKFIRGSVSALENHRLASGYLRIKDMNSAVTEIIRTGEIAGDQLGLAKKLVDQASKICTALGKVFVKTAEEITSKAEGRGVDSCR